MQRGDEALEAAFEETQKTKRKKEEIRGDSHSVLTENRKGRGPLIKRYWILVTQSPGNCVVALLPEIQF